MPSQNQPADTSDRLRCPSIVERIGEDPARWLDWDLLADPQRAEMVRTLIDGIETVERLRAWRAVERKLANDDHNDGARNPLRNRGRPSCSAWTSARSGSNSMANGATGCPTRSTSPVSAVTPMAS
ncbi:hypothetical protein ACFQER_15990 [Halomicroarcula sp. GCM10025894]|uniref:hypothetical protein n=1 Tax=Halomicroarcula sp. GCM10025894 TaxID=3252673 RepID=UPI00361C199E